MNVTICLSRIIIIVTIEITLLYVITFCVAVMALTGVPEATCSSIEGATLVELLPMLQYQLFEEHTEPLCIII